MGDCSVVWLLIICLHLIGVLHAIAAVFYIRTPQGVVAWAVCLTLFPYVALPFFWGFGPRRFYSYKKKISEAHQDFERSFEPEITDRERQTLVPELPQGFEDDQKFFEELAEASFTSGNSVELFERGEAYFDAVFQEIEKAERYILLQYYIVRSDKTGEKLAELLFSKVRAGVQVYFLYDQIGCVFLSNRYLASLREGGVHVASFKTNSGVRNPFLLNFRNHRKIVVCDGKVAFLGGSNIGDEYRGKSSWYKEWRDTDLRVRGPALHAIQRSFARDWFWATEEPLHQLDWKIREEEENLTSLAIHTGPLSRFDEASLLALNLLSLAEKRIWIATPYLVPDEGIIKVLQLAALRGIDVRIVLPQIWDHVLVTLATSYYAREMAKVGVKIYRYQPGFMHQKVILIDDIYTCLGTMNLDCRSLHVNFELSLLTVSKAFSKKVEVMLTNDFENSEFITDEHYRNESGISVLLSHFARLFAPIL